MAETRTSRTELLIGAEGLEKLKNARVALFGVGGVGGFVAEALARAGVGFLDLIDADVVSESNINRQIIALSSTVGRDKVEVMRERILDINPEVAVRALKFFFDETTQDAIDFSEYDYVVDAIDFVKGKVLLAQKAQRTGTPLISCMGTGNKLHPEQFKISDIYKTTVCPLARTMRRELKLCGIKKLKVLYSTEEPAVKSVPPASISFVPSVAGLMIAGEVVNDLLK